MSVVDHEVAIVGSGFSGLGIAIELERAGRGDFVVLERAEAIGGTWRDNRYPGCACDVPAPLYSFSFAPNPDWSELYAGQEEIRAYLEDCVDRFGVRDRIRLGNGAASASWEEEAQRWRIRLDDGSELTARFLFGAIGGLTRPSLPAIEGGEDFEGPLVHSAAWDEGLEVEGRRIAVIGTGASAIQLIPQLAERGAKVSVMQRTAPWVLPRPHLRFPTAARTLFRRFPGAQKLLRGAIFAFQESLALPLNNPPLTRILELVARLHLRRQVRDPHLRRRLTPGYRVGCKRMLGANDYYPAFNRPGTELVTDPIERIDAGGIVLEGGRRIDCDAIVCATGFNIREAFEQVELRGRGGRSLTETWGERIEAHRGTMVAGFPNFLMLSGPNTATGNMSQVFMVEAQIRFALDMLERMEQRGAAEIEVRAGAQQAYNRELVERMAGTVWIQGGCASWYLTEEGHTGVLYPGYSSGFRRSLRRMREQEYALSAPRRAPERERPHPTPA